MKKIQIIILAAGQGTRMKSDVPKVFHPLGGKPVLHHVFDTSKKLNPEKMILVMSPQLKEFQIPSSVISVIQEPALGTGDAVKYALPHLDLDGYVLILFGDTPLITETTLKKMLVTVEKNSEIALLVLGMDLEDKQHYARLIVNKDGHLTHIVEHKDLSSEQKDISLCNSGVMLIKSDVLHELLPKIEPLNAAKEYYLTDLVKLASSSGYMAQVLLGDHEEFLGINNRSDLAIAEEICQKRWRQQALEHGVTLVDPKSIFFSHDTIYENDVVIHPFVVMGPQVKIAKGATIHSFSQLTQTQIGENAVVGPFAHLRGNVILEQDVQIGNFVEIKNSIFKKNSKAKHLSYIGDAEVGESSNIGAGTVTCNYDGYKKHKTKIGKEAFIGSNTSLLAPISVGDRAIVGAGSVVYENIEDNDLALGRTRQVTLKEGAKKFRDKKVKG